MFLAALNGDYFKDALKRLRRQGGRIARAEVQVENLDYMVKLFLPDSYAKWIISYIEPDTPERMWGLADLGLDIMEYGLISLEELARLRGPLGCRVQVDLFFRERKSFGEIMKICQINNRIIF
jgi:Protein of unknown function (DUF2958)